MDAFELKVAQPDPILKASHAVYIAGAFYGAIQNMIERVKAQSKSPFAQPVSEAISSGPPLNVLQS